MTIVILLQFYVFSKDWFEKMTLLLLPFLIFNRNAKFRQDVFPFLSHCALLWIIIEFNLLQQCVFQDYHAKLMSIAQILLYSCETARCTYCRTKWPHLKLTARLLASCIVIKQGLISTVFIVFVTIYISLC